MLEKTFQRRGQNLSKERTITRSGVTKPCRYLVFDLKVDAREDLLVWRRKSFQGEDDNKERGDQTM
jgi:hypothetical protein